LLLLTTEILIQQYHCLFQKCLPNFPSETRTKWDSPTSQLLNINGIVVEVSLNAITFISFFVKIDQLFPKLKGDTLHANPASLGMHKNLQVHVPDQEFCKISTIVNGVIESPDYKKCDSLSNISNLTHKSAGW